MDLCALEENEGYERRCGEIFFTTRGRLIIHCTLCEEKFVLFKAYFAHFLDLHLSEETENSEHDYLDVEYKLEDLQNISPTPGEEPDGNESFYSDVDEKVERTVPSDIEQDSQDSMMSNCIETQKRGVSHSSLLKGSFEIPTKVRDVQHRLYPRSALTPDEERKHKCPICGFGFKERHNMIHHLKRHTDKRDHKCLECDKGFYTRTELKIHMRSHKNGRERSYLCTECGASFYVNCDLTKHMKRHLGIKNETCNICSKKFYDRDQLRNHMKVHSSERPFVCKECNASFKEVKRLRNHMKIHGGKREFQCNLCLAAFNQKSLLSSHMNLRHKNYESKL